MRRQLVLVWHNDLFMQEKGGIVQKQKKSSPALDRIVNAIRDRAAHSNAAQEWHTDAHTDSGGGWHTDAWQG